MKIRFVFSVLFLVILSLLLLTACRKLEKIDADLVEKIVLWEHSPPGIPLTAEESAKFIELYNASEYDGKPTGEGGTPDFGIMVYFTDGTCLHANDFYGRLEAWITNPEGHTQDDFYIRSQELYAFVSELAAKATETGS